MAKQDQDEENLKKQKRDVSLRNLKGNLPGLAFVYTTQTDDRTWGQNGLVLGHTLYSSLLDKNDIRDYVIDSLKGSETNGIRSGQGIYNGQINSRSLIAGARSIIDESIENITFADAAELIDIDYNKSKWKDKYVGDLLNSSDEHEKKLGSEFYVAYNKYLTKKYFGKALKEDYERSKSNLEELAKSA